MCLCVDIYICIYTTMIGQLMLGYADFDFVFGGKKKEKKNQ